MKTPKKEGEAQPLIQKLHLIPIQKLAQILKTSHMFQKGQSSSARKKNVRKFLMKRRMLINRMMPCIWGQQLPHRGVWRAVRAFVQCPSTCLPWGTAELLVYPSNMLYLSYSQSHPVKLSGDRLGTQSVLLQILQNNGTLHRKRRGCVRVWRTKIDGECGSRDDTENLSSKSFLKVGLSDVLPSRRTACYLAYGESWMWNLCQVAIHHF